MWTYGYKTNCKEAIARVERLFGYLQNESTLLSNDENFSKLEYSPLLNLDKYRTYQMLLGILQWLVIIGKLELCPLVSLLNRFASCPREFHPKLTVCAFGYLKTVKHKQIAIDWRPIQATWTNPNYDTLILYFCKIILMPLRILIPGFHLFLVPFF